MYQEYKNIRLLFVPNPFSARLFLQSYSYITNNYLFIFKLFEKYPKLGKVYRSYSGKNKNSVMDIQCLVAGKKHRHLFSINSPGWIKNTAEDMKGCIVIFVK